MLEWRALAEPVLLKTPNMASIALQQMMIYRIIYPLQNVHYSVHYLPLNAAKIFRIRVISAMVEATHFIKLLHTYVKLLYVYGKRGIVAIPSRL